MSSGILPDPITTPTATPTPATSPVSNTGSGPAGVPFPIQVDPVELPNARTAMLHGLGACFLSMLTHVGILVLLGLLLMPDVVSNTMETIVATVLEEREEDLLKIELEESLEPAREITDATVSAVPKVGAMGSELSGGVSSPQLEREVVEQLDAPPITVGSPVLSLPSTNKLIASVPEGVLGDPRAIVDSYQQAMDRITQEIMWMLDQGDVLVIWCFDQSESMKDDQQEIRDRVYRIYAELGLTDKSSGDHLLTSVVSYGSSFRLHTSKPTSDVSVIRKAIAEVPVDPSGKEMMCEAMGRSIAMHRDVAKRGRQMALILVTDESGDTENNDRFLELAIAEARAAKCRVYTLGREAVFGYPFAFMRYQHPQTNRIHWLPVDRGPETAFVEQLQTNGFRRRHDSFSSGFGPYEQTRMSRETGGIFFMLPTVEKDLVQSDKRRYSLEAMQAYRPDLRARAEVLDERESYPLRKLLWTVINDLNPYNKGAARVIEMRMDFAIKPDEFLRQARQEQAKAKRFLDYLALAEKELESGRELRAQEPEPRWQANYDLMIAQVVAYQARLYEYGLALEDFIRQPKTAAAQKPPNLTLTDWNITVRNRAIRGGEQSQAYIDRSKQLFQIVIDNHPGTPWASRAQRELSRGFGIELVPDYHGPYRQVPNPMPLPKL